MTDSRRTAAAKRWLRQELEEALPVHVLTGTIVAAIEDLIDARIEDAFKQAVLQPRPTTESDGA